MRALADRDQWHVVSAPNIHPALLKHQMGSLQASNWRFDVREAVNRAANRGVSPDANQGGGFGLFIKAANIKAQ